MKFIGQQFQNATIQAIIFDLGAVILDIDYHLTKQSFLQLGVNDFDHLFSKVSQTSLFDSFEKGEISNGDFREKLNQCFSMRFSDEQIDSAWNSMLLNLPLKRILLLENLAKYYPLFLLSNTNSIHEKSFMRKIDKQYGISRFNRVFSKIYFSHKIGMRKPEAEVFLHVIKENNLIPQTTLFIDDSPQHIEGASKCGILAYHLKPEQDICDLFIQSE